MEVTENLFVALEHFQHDTLTLALWVDAICINQKDEAEKSTQVQRMGNFYSTATIVLAWLGPASDESDLTIEASDAFHLRSEKEQSHFVKTASEEEIRRVLPLDLITLFFKRPYFTRVWVGQEVALSKHALFVCGRHATPSSRLIDLWAGCISAMARFSSTILPLGFVTRFQGREAVNFSAFLKSSRDIFVFLTDGFHLRASEPRDFVFSLLGLFINAGNMEMAVDYTRSVEEVYTGLAESIIRSNPRSLFQFWGCPKNFEQLPSWVPDWSTTFINIVRLRSRFAIPGSPPPQVRRTDAGRATLEISAYCIDEVSRVVPGMTVRKDETVHELMARHSKIGYQDACSFLQNIEALIAESKTRYTRKRDRSIFDASVGLNRVYLYPTGPGKEELYRSYCKMRQRSSLRLKSLGEDPIHIEDDTEGGIYLAALRLAPVQHIFTTAKGHVGLATDLVQIGDHIVLCDQAGGPFVMRKTDDLYSLASQAYIIDLDTSSSRGLRSETITII